MTSTNRFVILSEFGSKFLAFLYLSLSKGLFAFFLTLHFSLSCTPAMLLAEEKQTGETKKSRTSKNC